MGRSGGARRAQPPLGAAGAGSPASPGPSAAASGEYLRTLTPDATLARADGSVVDLIGATRTQAHLLLHLGPECVHCEAVAERVPSWVERMPQIAVRVVVTLTPEQLADRRPQWAPFALYDADSTTTRMLRLVGTPSAVLLGTDGMLVGGPVAGADEVLALVDDIAVELGVA